jgi:hypothetical protein
VVRFFNPSEIRYAVTDVPQLNKRNRGVERGKNCTGHGGADGLDKKVIVLRKGPNVVSFVCF